MTKTILITGATDGIGRLAAVKLAQEGHHVLLHGRSAAKLDVVSDEIGESGGSYRADLTSLREVEALADAVLADHRTIDVLVNNAGVFRMAEPILPDGMDARFVVNTLAPFLLTRRLLPHIPKAGRVLNLSSAAQARVNIDALLGQEQLEAMSAYAQSKLAITIWTSEMARMHPDGPVFVAINPGSLLATKMVKEGFGVPGQDLNIGADILCRAALDDSFAHASGQYFDNDAGGFGHPDPAARDAAHVQAVMHAIEARV